MEYSILRSGSFLTYSVFDGRDGASQSISQPSNEMSLEEAAPQLIADILVGPLVSLPPDNSYGR